MDSNNLATLFAPNILHSGSNASVTKDSLSSQSCEERIDVINVIRSMIDHNKDLFQVRSLNSMNIKLTVKLLRMSACDGQF